jgi:hypothetical protein
LWEPAVAVDNGQFGCRIFYDPSEPHSSTNFGITSVCPPVDATISQMEYVIGLPFLHLSRFLIRWLIVELAIRLRLTPDSAAWIASFR